MSVKDIEFFQQPPIDFAPTVAISVVWLAVKEHILFLQKSLHSKFAPNQWAPIGGKIDMTEDPSSAACREALEETGININIQAIKLTTILYVRTVKLDFIYHMFSLHYLTKPEIILSAEHQSFKWVTLQQALKLDLMPGVAQTIEIYRAANKVA